MVEMIRPIAATLNHEIEDIEASRYKEPRFLVTMEPYQPSTFCLDIHMGEK